MDCLKIAIFVLHKYLYINPNNPIVMNAKIERISELSTLMSQKDLTSKDLLCLLGQFGLGHLLSRLSLEKQQGIRASDLILLPSAYFVFMVKAYILFIIKDLTIFFWLARIVSIGCLAGSQWTGVVCYMAWSCVIGLFCVESMQIRIPLQPHAVTCSMILRWKRPALILNA
jgi:hypothetical protein